MRTRMGAAAGTGGVLPDMRLDQACDMNLNQFGLSPRLAIFTIER
jgi:hypothetical protein